MATKSKHSRRNLTDRDQLILWSVTCLLLLVMLSFVERKHAKQYCTAVHIDIASEGRLFFLTESDIKQMLPSELAGDFPKLALEELEGTQVLEQRINDNPYVQKSEVFVDVKGELHIRVLPMRPLVRVFNKIGQSYYIDLEGNKMPLMSKYTAKVPIVTNFRDSGTTKGMVQEGAEAQLYAFAGMIDRDPFFRALVSQIEIKNSEFTIYPIVGDFEIALGRMSNMDKKLAQIKALYKKGLGRQDMLWNDFTRINSQKEGLAGVEIKSHQDL